MKNAQISYDEKLQVYHIKVEGRSEIVVPSEEFAEKLSGLSTEVNSVEDWQGAVDEYLAEMAEIPTPAPEPAVDETSAA